MIARYTALGLLFILFFSPIRVLAGVESNIYEDVDSQIEELVSSLLNDPDHLLKELNTLLEGKDHNYYSLLASLYIATSDFAGGEKCILSNKNYRDDKKLLEQLIYCLKGQNKQTEQVYKELEILDPLNLMVLEYKAEKYVKNNDFDKAENVLLELYELVPDRERTLIGLGDLYLYKVESLGLQDKKVLSSEEDTLVTSYYKQALHFYKKVKKNKTALYYNKIASIYKKLGNTYNSVKALNSAIELDPTDPWNYYDKGKIFFYLSDYEQALDNFKMVYKLSPDHFFGNVFLGRIYFILNDIDKAVKHYSIVLSQNKDYTPAWFHYAVLSYIKGYKEISLKFQIDIYNKNILRNKYLSLFLLETLTEVGDEAMVKKIATELVKKEKNVTMKGIYNFYLNDKKTDTDVLNKALDLEDETERLRLSYYVSNALYREGVKSLSRSLLQEVEFSKVEYESKLAKYKLGVLYD